MPARLLVFVALLCSAALFGSHGVGIAASAETPCPNIVMIFADDLACARLERLRRRTEAARHAPPRPARREGVRFDRCLVTNSICGPSRATILTGKYSHLNGFYNNTNCTFDG